MKMKTIITGLTALLVTASIVPVCSFAASLGEVNGDSSINAKDAAEVLVHAANVGAGNGGTLSEEALTAADVNGDNTVNAMDAAEILVYSAEKGAGGSPVFSKEKYTISKAYWLDMSQESDFFFEGEFLVYEFEIKENTPDGIYPITIEKADISSWDVVTWTPKIINGEIAVNTKPTVQEDFPDDAFALKVNSVSGKPGDTVTVTVDLKNNPGFCGFVIHMKYDKTALTLINSTSGADFKQTIQIEDTAKSDEWKDAYQQQISTLSSDYCYHLYDMDGDDIPELFTAAKNGSKQEGVSVYTYKNNALLSLGEYGRYGMLYVSGQYLVDYSDAKMSELQNYFYFDGTSVTLKDYICKSEYYAPYSVNGEEVSEEVYNSYRAKYPAFPDEYTEIGLDEYIGFGTAYDVSNLSPIENY